MADHAPPMPDFSAVPNRPFALRQQSDKPTGRAGLQVLQDCGGAGKVGRGAAAFRQREAESGGNRVDRLVEFMAP